MSTRPEVDRFVFEELEQRILFSADIAALAPALTHADVGSLDLPQYQGPVLPQQLGTPSNEAEPAQQPRHEVVFIDGAVENAQALAKQLMAEQDPGRVLSVYVLDPGRDGVAQISDVLATQHDLNAIHIISHGSDGQLQLGSTQLNGSNLPNNALAISGWGAAMATGGDILLYGCDVAQTETGQQFVDTLGKLTGADMAASNNLTGSAAQHGDWTLEYSSAKIDTKVVADAAVQLSYSGILAIYNVSNTADSGAGSLRDAITNANASTGIDTIRFTIGAGTITLASALPTVSDQTIIDARTASGYAGTPIIELNGNGVSGSGLAFSAANSAVYGLSITNFSGNGVDVLNTASNFTFQGNYVGLRTDGTTALGNSGDGINLAGSNILIGGTTAQARNVISGNSGNGVGEQGGASNVLIEGNYFGTNAAGTAIRANVGNGVAIAGSNTIVGGSSAGSGNLLSGNGQNGIIVTSAASAISLLGNLVGLNASGTAALGNSQIGIFLDGATGVTVGGTAAGAGNVVSGNGNDGIWSSGVNNTFLGNYVGSDITGTVSLGNGWSGFSIRAANNTVGGTAAGSGNVVIGNGQEGIFIETSNVIVQGNSIGVNAAGNAAGNSATGITVNSGSNITIGGTAAGTGNLIANNSIGVSIKNAATGVAILGNTIYGNSNLGIDLGTTAGVTPNDAGDADTGANNLQNFPVITAVQSNRSNTNIQGTFNSNANRSYRLEFFASSTRDSSGYGEAQLYLGFVNVTTDASGNATFSASVAGLNPDNLWISATATDTTTNDTSEFALDVQATILNAAPQGSNKTITSNEDTAYVMTVADFGFSDPNNNSANNFASVIITSQPGSGTLTNNGAAIANGMAVSVADINAGKLVYTPAANANGNGLANFGFKVTDDGGTANGGADTDATTRTITFNITAVNDAPVLSTTPALTPYVENGAALAIDSGITLSDVDSTQMAWADIRITGNASSGDLLGLASNPGTMGDIAQTATGNPYLVHLVSASGTATLAQWQAALRAVSYSSSSDNPNTANRTISFSINDGSSTSAVVTKTVSVTAVNDPPVGTNHTANLYDTVDYTFTAADFGFTDPADGGANNFLSVVISSIPATGTLSNNGVALNAGDVVLKADIDAGKLLFSYWQPHSSYVAGATYAPGTSYSYTGNTSFTFRVRDDGGTANGGVDTDTTARTMTLAVTQLNHAPQGAANTVTTLEDTPYTFSAADFGFSDPNNNPADTLLEVVLTTLPAGGTLTYYGAAFPAGDFVHLSDLNAGALVYTPAADVHGMAAASFTFQVRDTGGTANGGVDTDATPRLMTINLTAVNDAPAGASHTVTTLEDTPYTFVAADFGYADTHDSPADNFLSVILSSIPASGSLMLDNVAVTAGQEVLKSDIDAGKLVYTPVTDTNGAALAAFTFRVRDGGGTANGGVDTDPTARTMSITVSAVNNAPAGADHAVSTLEDQPYTFVAADFGYTDVHDSPANNFLSVILSTIPASGALRLDGVAVTAGQEVLKTDIAAGKLVYAPAANANGAALAAFTFQVRDDGGTANGGANTDPTARAMTIDVTAVNDAPAGADNSIAVVAGQAHTFSVANFGFSDGADSPANQLMAVFITSLPATGTVTLNGNAISAGMAIARSDLDGGRLLYIAPASTGALLRASFGFRVQDDGGTLNGGLDTDSVARSMQIQVSAVLLPVVPHQPSTGTGTGSGSGSGSGAGSGTPVVSLIPVNALTAGAVAGQPMANGEVAPAANQAAVLDTADGQSAADRAAATAAAATAAGTGVDPSKRVDVAISTGARRLAIETDASIIRANIVRFLGDKADYAPPAVIQQAAAGTAPESASLFKAEVVVVQAPVDHRNIMLSQLKTGSGDSASRAVLPARASAEESRQEYSALRSTAHRIESAIAVSALGTIWVVARKAALVASLLSTVPAWMRLDPLPILAGDEEPEEELEPGEEQTQTDSVEHLFTVTANQQEPSQEARPQ